VRGQPSIGWIAAWFQSSTGAINHRRGRTEKKKSLLLIIRVETLKQLQEQASEAAGAQGLTKTDLAYGDFLQPPLLRAEHNGR
jgi:hypothetical protein